MKKLILILLCVTTIAQAQLLDLTPGGFDPNNGLPPPYFLLAEQVFFDEAAHGVFCLPTGCEYFNRWVSMFGELNGGTYFFTDLFRIGDSPSASVWWDFRQDNHGMTMLDVWGRKPDGTVREHIYGVPRNKARREQPVMVTLDGMTIIESIAFYGTDSRQRGRRVPARLIREYATRGAQ